MPGYRRASRRRYVLALLVLTAVTLITLDRRSDDDGALGSLGRVAHTVVGPVERGVAVVFDPVDDWFAGLTDGTSIKRENERLRRELSELEDERRRAVAALAENEVLRRELELPVLDDVERVTARVVNRSPGNFEATITIDKGEERGISPNMPVMSSSGLVGKVLESWPGGAKIRLVVDADSAVAVRVLPANVGAVALGRPGTDLLRLDLDSDAQVAAGDEVSTSGLQNSVFPEGISVGRVVRVDAQPAGLGMVVRVEPWVDFDELEYVTVLRWVPGQGPVLATTTTTAPDAPTTTVPSD
jgi:rod shape-determining protein MreC